MKEFILKHKYAFILLVPGIIAGFIYWKYVGCLSGTCPITSNWHTMVLFGGIFGYLIGDMIDDKATKKSE
ncbi:MAG: DUF6132 family protein [Bacteroidales bacterium]|jgi:hypothetical protein|nr:DUF6132 family protein [Bacteroidales bacterium]